MRVVMLLFQFLEVDGWVWIGEHVERRFMISTILSEEDGKRALDLRIDLI